MTTSAHATHISVLLNEVLEALLPACSTASARLLDGTLGLAGHSAALLERLAADGITAQLCGLDRDEEALTRARERLSAFPGQTQLFHSDYASFPNALDELGWPTVDAALLDLGVSSLQLDVAERGFSLHADAPLDMRMDMRPDHISSAPNAKELVNRATFEELKRIIEQYGEDPQAGRIARAIVDERQKKTIESTGQLADLVYRAYPPKWRATARNHPATRTFQALRMEVNDELGQLERFLDHILPRLSKGGRLAIISFHSLEDRIVKQRFRLWSTECVCPPHIPRCVCQHKPEIYLITRKPIVPTPEECRANSRASSAKMRVAEAWPFREEAPAPLEESHA